MHIGSRANITAVRADLLLNARTDDDSVRKHVLPATERIDRAEREAALPLLGNG